MWAPLTAFHRLGFPSPLLPSLQATRNLSDLWLSYWVSHTPAPTPGHGVPPHPAALALRLHPHLALSWLGWRPLEHGSSGGSGCGPATWQHTGWASVVGPAGSLDPEVRYYLGVLLAIAVANMAFTLVSYECVMFVVAACMAEGAGAGCSFTSSVWAVGGSACCVLHRCATVEAQGALDHQRAMQAAYGT